MTARLRTIGRDLRSKLEGFFETTLEAGATPLELMHACLERAESLVQPAGRGRRIFPYNRVVVTIRQRGADPASVDAVFADLDSRLRERLTELNCDMPSLQTSVVVVEDADPAAGPVVSVEGFTEPRLATPPLLPSETCPVVRVTVEKGACSETEYVFEEPLIAIGRTAEPTDVNGQMRRNDVVFSETRDGVTETVGRAHARLEFDRTSGQYLLFNEGSSNPTSISRGGRMFRVAPRDPRGVRVRSGDRIQLGRAVLRVTIEQPPSLTAPRSST